ncbi:hypothetical protein HII31_00868 [Pseudocercospora fuligena]|uniref:Uncharacterized protein n=1 Tax=Pseudocercospora fuligena TaxID=685502 RepID=A0A8H6RV38_9PEZI|nr:hypothetical protein HII31_00868 [Pseudocercospora fuligena]
MVSTRSGGGRKSPKSPLKPQPSKVKKGKKAAPKSKKPTKKKTNSKKSNPSTEKRVSWEETETEYSDENDDINSPYAAGKHRSPTSYKAPKGSRRYSGKGRLVNNKGTYSGVRPKSSPGLGRKGHDDEDSESETGFGDVGPAPATVHKNRASPSSPRMDMELKADELAGELMNVQVEFWRAGLQHRSFNMVSKHLSLAIEILLDMRKYPGSWPEGLDDISVPTWRNKILDVLEHIADNDPNNPKLERIHDPLWPGAKALEERSGYHLANGRFRARVAPDYEVFEPLDLGYIPEQDVHTSTTPYVINPTDGQRRGLSYGPTSPYRLSSSARKSKSPYPRNVTAPKSPNTRGSSFSYDPPTPYWSLD